MTNLLVGLEVVRSISELYRIHGIKTQVLSAQFVVYRGSLDPTITALQVVTIFHLIFSRKCVSPCFDGQRS